MKNYTEASWLGKRRGDGKYFLATSLLGKEVMKNEVTKIYSHSLLP
jgi:hypothetical protein